MKVRLQHPGGWWVDRVPAWIRWATVEANKMGAKYDGIHWDPPQGQRHSWCARAAHTLAALLPLPAPPPERSVAGASPMSQYRLAGCRQAAARTCVR